MINLKEVLTEGRHISQNDLDFDSISSCGNCAFYDFTLGDSYCTNKDGRVNGQKLAERGSPFSLMMGLNMKDKLVGCEYGFFYFPEMQFLNLSSSESYLRKRALEKELPVSSAKFNAGELYEMYKSNFKLF
jgi:hypothetical protein